MGRASGAMSLTHEREFTMLVFKLLQAMNTEIVPMNTKVHLATAPKKGEDPLVLFREGKFSEWQAQQNRQNFERDHVIALIELPDADRWLYAGVWYQRASVVQNGLVKYNLVPVEACTVLAGRLVVAYNAYLSCGVPQCRDAGHAARHA